MVTPVQVKLHPGSKIPNLKQQPLREHARKGIQPVISAFLEHNLICLCQSPYNTPILPVQKPGTHEYHFVQDLRAINQIAEDIHLVVANPYTLLTTLSWDFCWPYGLGPTRHLLLHTLKSQISGFFAFEWDDPETKLKQQFCWIVLPPRIQERPHHFQESPSQRANGPTVIRRNLTSVCR